MLARILEEADLVTVTLAIVREHAEKVKPPRALFVPFAMGFPMGRPNDAEIQHRVLAAAFDLLKYRGGPVLVDFPEEDTPQTLPQSSSVRPSSSISPWESADEVTAMRAFYEQWVKDHGGKTAVGLSGISQRRFRGVIRFLEGYAQGENADLEERPRSMEIEQFVRYCVDDLKAFFFEARMAQSPDATETALHRWFWGDTSFAQLCKNVAQRMSAAGGLKYKSTAFGIAR